MRFHVHLHVNNLEANIAFYSKLFAAKPIRIEADYAKWMLEDTRVNFAISTRGNVTGVDHLGLQADELEELAMLKGRAHDDDMVLLDQRVTNCRHARSERHFVIVPQGVAWKHFHTLKNIPVFGQSAERGASSGKVCRAASNPGNSAKPSTRDTPTCC